MASDNTKALDALASMIEKLRRLEELPEKVAPRVTEAVKATLAEQIAAAKFPSGAAWPDTQDGRKALRNAAQALSVKALGNVIVARLTGPEARHSVGAVKGNIQRQILPSARGQLKAIGLAVAKTLREATREALK